MSQQQSLQPTNPLGMMIKNSTQLQLANKKTTIVDKENITPTGLKSQQLSKPMKKEISLKPSNKLGELKRKLHQSTQLPSSDPSKLQSPSKKKKFSIFEDNHQFKSRQSLNSPTLSIGLSQNIPKTVIEYEIIEEDCIVQPYLEKIKELENEIVELTNDKTYYQLMYHTLSISNDTRLTIDNLKKQITLLENTKNLFRNKIVSLSKEKEVMKIEFEKQLDLQKQAEKHLRDMLQQSHEETVSKLQSEIEQLKKVVTDQQ